MSDMKITGVASLPPEQVLQPKRVNGEGFGSLLEDALGKVNGLDRDANRSVAELLEGKADVQEVMVAMQKADISMRLLLTVRNKVIEAYKEIMHMQF